jgi:hypothetical protein
MQFGSLEKMINSPVSSWYLQLNPKHKAKIKSIARILNSDNKRFYKHLLSRPRKSRTTLQFILKEFFTYMLSNSKDFRGKRGLLMQLKRYPHSIHPVDRQNRRNALIRNRYNLMRKIDDLCLENGIDLKVMVLDKNTASAAAFTIYMIKSALKGKLPLQKALEDSKAFVFEIPKLVEILTLSSKKTMDQEGQGPEGRNLS